MKLVSKKKIHRYSTRVGGQLALGEELQRYKDAAKLLGVPYRVMYVGSRKNQNSTTTTNRKNARAARFYLRQEFSTWVSEWVND